MKKLITWILLISISINLMGCSNEGKQDVTGKNVGSVNEEDTKTVDQEPAEKETVESKPAYDNLYPDFILDETDTSITYVDKFGTETRITKNPKKVVVAYNSILGLWYYAGGTSLTKVKGSINVPEEAKENIDLGSSSSVSLEAVIALEPDLVILAANVDSQVALAPTLNESGIETMIIDTSINSFERFKENSYLFSKINQTEAGYDANINPIIEDVNGVIEKAKKADKKSRVAAIFASSKSMSLESDIALTGEMVQLLGGDNILSENDIKAEGETRVSFSIEALVSQNPEVIMISTMGKIDASKETVEKMIAENPVWHEVDAVKNNRVYYLPKEFSVYKPNEKYGDAFHHIASLLYPELFGDE